MAGGSLRWRVAGALTGSDTFSIPNEVRPHCAAADQGDQPYPMLWEVLRLESGGDGLRLNAGQGLSQSARARFIRPAFFVPVKKTKSIQGILLRLRQLRYSMKAQQ